MRITREQRPLRDLVKKLLRGSEWDELIKIFEIHPHFIWLVRNECGECSLNYAILGKNVFMVRRIAEILDRLDENKELARKKTFNCRTRQRDNTLYWAVASGNFEIFKIVLDRHTSVLSVFTKAMFYHAVLCGGVEIAKYILERHPKKEQLLLENNDHPLTLIDPHHHTFMETALYSQKLEMIKFIHENAPDKHKIFDNPYGRGENARMIAESALPDQKKVEILEYLMQFDHPCNALKAHTMKNDCTSIACFLSHTCGRYPSEIGSQHRRNFLEDNIHWVSLETRRQLVFYFQQSEIETIKQSIYSGSPNSLVTLVFRILRQNALLKFWNSYWYDNTDSVYNDLVFKMH